MDKEIFELDRNFRKEIYKMTVDTYAKFLSDLAREMKEFQKEILSEVLSEKEKVDEEQAEKQKVNQDMIKQFAE